IAAINDRSFWPEILEELNARLPESDIWITELVATSGGKPVGANEKRATEVAPTPPPVASAAKPGTKAGSVSGPVIDGITVRGLYLLNSKQQEVVIDYFRNLASSTFFVIDAKKPESVIKSNSVPNET